MQRFAKVLATSLGAVVLGIAAQSSLLPASAQTSGDRGFPHRGSLSGIGGAAARPAVSGVSHEPAIPSVSNSDTATLPAPGSILYSFGASTTDGFLPYAGVIQASDGNFYGATARGGQYNIGTFYKLTLSGQETVIHSFGGADDGSSPLSTPIEASDGNIYGVAEAGGPNDYGSIYQYNLTTGVFTVVYLFQAADGYGPESALIDDGKGTLYSTAGYGGVNNVGSVWSWNYHTNTFKTLYSFLGTTDGLDPEAGLVLANDGNLYGTSGQGGAGGGYGTAFMLGTDGSNFQVIHTFTNGADGGYPGDLVEYSDGNLYGISNSGASEGAGNFFQIVPNGVNSTVNSIHDFTPPGAYEQGYGHPFIGGDGKFYAALQSGGMNFDGQVVQLDTLGNVADVYDFVIVGGDDAFPYSTVLEGADGNLYGSTYYNGTHYLGTTLGIGTIYRVATALPPVITLTPSAGSVDAGKSVTLTWAANNVYSKNDQVCVAYSSDGTWTGVVAPSGTATVSPVGPNTVNYAITCAGVETATTSLVVGSSVPLSVTTTSLGNGVVGTAYYQALAATGGTQPYKWSLQSGSLPQGLTLVPGTGAISGTPTQTGTQSFVIAVTDSEGTPVTATADLSITISSIGVLTTSLPNGAVGSAYGQTLQAGGGTPPYIWSITGSLPAGLTLSPGTGAITGIPTTAGLASFTVQAKDSASPSATASANLSINIVGASAGAALPVSERTFYTFNTFPTPGDGGNPEAGIMQASDGNFYGTNYEYGSNQDGTLYKLTPSGQETILHAFSSAEGTNPVGTPIEASDGNIYGTTLYGGPGGGGGIYQYNLQTGAFTVLHSFPYAYPSGDLIDDGKGTLYGTCQKNGANYLGSIWSWNYLTNTFTTIYNFTGGNDGGNASGGLVLASDGNLYGMTTSGGANGNGTIYALATDGSNFTPVYAFTDYNAAPFGGLVQYSDGNLYGFTHFDGANGYGVFFQLVPNGANSTYKILYQFQSTDGTVPIYGHPFIGGDGKFYIAGSSGGALNSQGQIMQLDSLGNKADVYDFGSTAQDGTNPYAQPFESTDGNLYGTTNANGFLGFGTVYEALTELPPVISLSASSLEVAPGSSMILVWAVNNAYSKDAQVCIARSTDGSWTGSLPTSGSATITPTGSGAVFYSITCGGRETATVVVNGNTPLVITTTSLPDGQIDTAYTSPAPTVSGGTPPYTWSIASGSLPVGLSLAPSTGIINGLPTQAGTTDFTLQVTDSEGIPVTSTAHLTLTITSSALAVTTTSLSSGAVGSAYSQSMSATGGVTPYTWSVVSGTLPAGISLDAGTGILSGTPSQAGTANLVIQVADSAGTKATATLSLTVASVSLPVITTTSLPSGIVGTAYSQTLAASGGTAPYTWSISSGDLPAGLSLASATGVLSGTPTSAETSNFTVKAVDSESSPASATAVLNLLINPVATAPLAPTVTVSLNPSSVAAGQSTTITATLSGSAGSPTGTVQFQSNSSNLGTPVPVANGVAVLQNQVFSTAGSFAITADYSGDTNYTPLNSAPTTLTVTGTGTPAISAAPATVTISAPGGSGSTTLTFSNFSNSSITVSCAGLPTGAACNPGALNSSSGAATSILQITTTGSTTASSKTAAPANRKGSPVIYALAFPGILAIAGLFPSRRRHPHWRRICMFLLLLSMGGALTACGGSGSNSNPNETPTGTSTVTVTATSGSQSATLNITLVVQ